MTTPTTLAEAIAAEENGKGSLRLVDGEPVWTDAPPRFQRRTNPTPVANPEVSALEIEAQLIEVKRADLARKLDDLSVKRRAIEKQRLKALARGRSQ